MTTNNHAPRRIGLLGGSFNPPHDGHREITLAALGRLNLDAVWWLVTPGNPLKNASDYAPYERRLSLARQLADHPDIVVSDFERRHNLQYTAETIERIQLLNPTSDFIWLMGADSLINFHKWKNWETIANLAPIAVFNRPGYGDDALSGEAARTLSAFRLPEQYPENLLEREPPAWIYFSDTNNASSSTAIRNATKTGKRTNMKAEETTDLTAPHGPLAFFLDMHPEVSDFRTDVIAGLSKPQKSLSPMYLYDERGSQIFYEITRLEAYYPTRTEQKIIQQNSQEISAAVGANVGIFEYGAGSAEKIRNLLALLKEPCSYVAVDISRDHLLENAAALAKDAAPLPVAAICADFNEKIDVPDGILPDLDHLLGFFPGSTIGNLSIAGAQKLLSNASATLGENAMFLLGVDMKKDPEILREAYDDKQGVSAAFNLNLLTRMKRELDAEIDLGAFEHHIKINSNPQRVEMHLRAIKATSIIIGDHQFDFRAGETLHTENSHKYSIERLNSVIGETPWRLEKVWTDDRDWFAACLLSNN